MKEVVEREEIIERVAALDIGKAVLTCCVRVPGPSGRRMQDVTDYSALPSALFVLIVRLRELGVTRVVMEATSDYWRTPFYMLEHAGFEVWLVNARDVKHLPGRPKTDRIDAVWLCKVAERQMVRASFVPSAELRQLRHLTRYRHNLVVARTAEKARVEKLLEDAGIKFSAVVSDIFGVSGRDMMASLIAGQRDPQVLAEKARGTMRSKRPALVEAFSGWFNDEHAWLLSKMLTRVDGLSTDIADVEQRIGILAAPWQADIDRLAEIPGVDVALARVIVAEIGVDMTRFPTPGHLASWAKFAPSVNLSAGRRKGSGKTGRGNKYLSAALGQAAMSTGRTKTFLGARYRRLATHRPKRCVIVAVGRSILNIVWYLLSHPDAHFQDLGADYYTTRIDKARTTRKHVKGLERCGYQVTLTLTG